VIRLLLVDDQALLRGGLRILIEGQEDMAVVGEASDGLEAIALARRLEPDVILMDVSMPGLDGLAATRELLAKAPEPAPRILILTTFDSDENVFGALRSGASGILAKDAEPFELLRAVRVVAAGEAVLSPSVTRRLILDYASRPERRDVTPEQLRWLTAREREVMALAATGLTNDEIAAELVITVATAKTHVSRAMRKLHARDRAQLVTFAYASGLVSQNGIAEALGRPA
jgi:DNA-binding NarL/FixJ family response regulator